MESKTAIKYFLCRTHPDELIQRVSTEVGASKPMLCIQCVADVESKEARAKLLSFKDYSEKVVFHYNSIKDSTQKNDTIPSDLTDVFSNESEVIANFTSHIENEKKRVAMAFSLISERFLEMIDSKKNQLLNSLDDQVLTLAFNFKTYKNKLQKLYKGINEFAETDLSKFISKINSCDSTTTVEDLIKSINSDMAENTLLLSTGHDEARKGLKDITDALKKQSLSKPSTVCSNQLATDEFVEKTSKKFDELFKEALEVKDRVEQLSGFGGLDSTIIKDSSAIMMLRKWISESGASNFKLLYRGSKDGFQAAKFHEKCNNKGATVMIAKSSLGKVFGGYTDKDWHSNGQYQNTNKCFLFSIDRKEKYKLKAGHEGTSVYCNASYGPTFGGGHDLYIIDSCNTNGSNYSNFPYSYDAPGANNTYLTGAYNFTVSEIEVFSVTN